MKDPRGKPTMSLFSWLFPSAATKKKKASSKPAFDSSGLSRMEPTRPVGRPGVKEQLHPSSNNAQPANRKNERMARRELLYSVVRDAMMRAGVLSASYKFKVLSLDARGRQFLVMVDLARDFGGETGRLAEIEALIAQGAKSRHDIIVTAVYWRMNEHVAVGDPMSAANRARAASGVSGPMPLESQPVPLDSAPAPLVVQKPAASPTSYDATLPLRPRAAGFEPLLADEVAAFKAALAAGISPRDAAAAVSKQAAAQQQQAPAPARSFDGTPRHGPQSYTLLTGFEDTEMPETSGERAPVLSGTQYGELR